MSDAKKPGSIRFPIIGLAAAAVIAGIYGFSGPERKIEPEAGLGAPATPGGSGLRAYATGTLAAFVIKAERKLVPDIAFADGSGRNLKLSAWKGRVVLLNMWATWCAPCRKEMPALAALQAKLGSTDFEVVAVSVDRKGVAASSAFLTENRATALKLYVEPTAGILNDMQALGLPATILIDRQGREVGRLLGPAKWDSPEAVKLIQAALAEK